MKSITVLSNDPKKNHIVLKLIGEIVAAQPKKTPPPAKENPIIKKIQTQN